MPTKRSLLMGVSAGSRIGKDLLTSSVNIMFDFEKLDLYQEVRAASCKILKWVAFHPTMDEYYSQRFKLVVTGIAAELAEGTARLGFHEKKKHYTDSRVFVFECVTLLHIMKDMDAISEDEFEDFYQDMDKISRMLLGMIRSQRKERDPQTNE